MGILGFLLATAACSDPVAGGSAGDAAGGESGFASDTESGIEESSESSAENGEETGTTDLPPLAGCGYTGSGPYMIPEPGEGDGYCEDVEPNNNPNEAVQCGRSDFNFYSSLYLTSQGHIGGEDSSGMFVPR